MSKEDFSFEDLDIFAKGENIVFCLCVYSFSTFIVSVFNLLEILARFDSSNIAHYYDLFCFIILNIIIAVFCNYFLFHNLAIFVFIGLILSMFIKSEKLGEIINTIRKECSKLFSLLYFGTATGLACWAGEYIFKDYFL